VAENDANGAPASDDGAPLTRADAIALAHRLADENLWSTRKIAQELTRRGHKVSHVTVQKYLAEARAQVPYLDLYQVNADRVAQRSRLEAYFQIVMEEVLGGRAEPLAAIKVLLDVEKVFTQIAGTAAPTRVVNETSNGQHKPDPEILAALAALPREDENEPPEGRAAALGGG